MLSFILGFYFGAVFGLGLLAYMEHRDDPRDTPESAEE